MVSPALSVTNAFFQDGRWPMKRPTRLCLPRTTRVRTSVTVTLNSDWIAARISILEDTLAKLGGAKRGPGRPKGSGAKAAGSATKAARKKPHWSPEARKAAKERMQKYWADRKKKAGKKA